jgi:hypothetical protein
MVKIARWSHDGGTQSGFVDDGACYALPPGQSVQTLLDAGLEDTLDLARQTTSSAPAVPLADVQLLAPLVPATIRDFVAFEEHVEGVRRSIDGVAGVVPEWYEAPTGGCRRRTRPGKRRTEPDRWGGAPAHLRLHHP